MKFKIAVVQNRAGTDRAANLEKGLYFCEQAKKAGADLVLFPECYLTGYHLPISRQEALDDDDASLRAFCVKAKELALGVVITAFTKGENAARNSAYLISRTGEILMRYDKVHTCDFADEACLESGASFQVGTFDGVRLGIMICYDREYPESARVLMLQGAELIVVPNDCGEMAPRLKALSTRAYENMVGVVMANPPGKNAGCSCAYSPICWDAHGSCVDNTILLADETTDGLFYADFDLAQLRAYRAKEMMGNTYRKVKAYGALLDGAVQAPFVRP